MSKSLIYQAYYTKSTPILNYMVGMLDLEEGGRILEPCAGDGVFIDKMLASMPSAKIDAYELNKDAAEVLRRKYSSSPNVSVVEADTLLAPEIASGPARYDKIIGNPPYGARCNHDKKTVLKSLYPDVYTKESYTLFLYACLRCLKEGASFVSLCQTPFFFCTVIRL